MRLRNIDYLDGEIVVIKILASPFYGQNTGIIALYISYWIFAIIISVKIFYNLPDDFDKLIAGEPELISDFLFYYQMMKECNVNEIM